MTDAEIEALLARLEAAIVTGNGYVEALKAWQAREPVDLCQKPGRLWTRADRRRVDTWLRESKRITRAADRHWRDVERDRALADTLTDDDLVLEGQRRLAAIREALTTLTTLKGAVS